LREREAEPRREPEDGANGRERELEARVENGVRVRAEQDERAEQEKVPAVALAGREPGQRRERSGDSRPHDRRLRTHGEDVAADARQRAELAEPARNADEPREDQHAAADQGHVLTGHGKKVIETRGPELLAELVGQSLVLAE